MAKRRNPRQSVFWVDETELDRLGARQLVLDGTIAETAKELDALAKALRPVRAEEADLKRQLGLTYDVAYAGDDPDKGIRIPGGAGATVRAPLFDRLTDIAERDGKRKVGWRRVKARLASYTKERDSIARAIENQQRRAERETIA